MDSSRNLCCQHPARDVNSFVYCELAKSQRDTGVKHVFDNLQPLRVVREGLIDLREKLGPKKFIGIL